MMRRPWAAAAVMLTLLLLTTLSCTLPALSGAGPLRGNPLATATPPGDSLELLIPAFTYNLQPGDTIPGTRLQYLGKSGDVYDVSIDGIESKKRFGDSFIWSGIVGPGVHATYNLRLTSDIVGPLPVAGTVTLVILNPNPIVNPAIPTFANGFRYNNVFVNYNVPVGRTIPGTTLTYDGVSMQGEVESARIGGTSGHPLFAVGDSITWQGTLRDNVTANFTFRTVNFNDNSLQLTGTAEIWVNP